MGTTIWGLGCRLNVDSRLISLGLNIRISTIIPIKGRGLTSKKGAHNNIAISAI